MDQLNDMLRDDFDPKTNLKKGVRAFFFGVFLPVIVGMASEKGVDPKLSTPILLGGTAMVRNFLKHRFPRAFGWL